MSFHEEKNVTPKSQSISRTTHQTTPKRVIQQVQFNVTQNDKTWEKKNPHRFFFKLPNALMQSLNIYSKINSLMFILMLSITDVACSFIALLKCLLWMFYSNASIIYDIAHLNKIYAH